MKTLSLSRNMIIRIALLVCLPPIVMAQPVSIPFHKEPYSLYSGIYDGLTDPAAKNFLAYRGVIQVPNAQWLRLHFQAYHLEEKGEYQ